MAAEDHLQGDETIVFRAHPSRIGLVPPIALAIVAALVGLVAYQRMASETAGRVALAVAGVVVLVALLSALVGLVRLRSNEYILTTHRLIEQYGILSKRSVDSYLSKINNVEHSQSLWGRILGFGDVMVDTASKDGITVFPRIAHPIEFKRAILAACEAYRGAGPAMAMTGAPAAAAPLSGAERLRQLKKLLDDGLISQEEYEAKRKQLVDQL
jgi:membrane protein YdbS with pleckstrin-like domain